MNIREKAKIAFTNKSLCPVCGEYFFHPKCCNGKYIRVKNIALLELEISFLVNQYLMSDNDWFWKHEIENKKAYYNWIMKSDDDKIIKEYLSLRPLFN